MTNKKKKNGISERAVVVTTAHRGVFVGYTLEQSNEVTTITLERAHMIVYWSSASRGVAGIAANGPAQGSRVSPAVRRIGLQNVTVVMDATPEAAAAWEKAPWG